MKHLTYSLAIGLSIFGMSLSASAEDKEKAIELGKQKFLVCGACHGVDGKGMQPAPGMIMAPAYAGSAVVDGNPEAFALAVMKGIKKEDAKFMGVMAPLEATLNDEELAAVITYIRNEFGKPKDHVTADQVKGWREKYKDRTEQATREELKKLSESK